MYGKEKQQNFLIKFFYQPFQKIQEKLVNVTRISGGLSIKNTNFEDLSFLNSIEWIGLNAYKSEYLASITISNNANLTSLKTNFKRDGLYLTVRDNPKLCMTTQNLDNLFYGLSLDSDLNINICFNEKTPDYWCDLPESGYFSVSNMLIDLSSRHQKGVFKKLKSIFYQTKYAFL